MDFECPGVKIAVFGMFHLGTVTAGCLAKAGYKVICYDQNTEAVAGLKIGKLPVNEPGLSNLIQIGMERGLLQFTTKLKDIADCNIFWVAYDTPLDEQDHADVSFVINNIKMLFSYLKNGDLIIVSSQLPVGTIAKLEDELQTNWPNLNVAFTCLPENLRLGEAIEVFINPDRVIAGIRSKKDKSRIANLLAPFTDNIIWMSVESAEMTKHAINAFLATSVSFINELAEICERYGADIFEVEKGLRSDKRVGRYGYIRPGPAFAGGTLSRELKYLLFLAHEKSLSPVLFEAILKSNDQHKNWHKQRLIKYFGSLKEKRICLLGLSYKSGTDTLRGSEAIETARWLDSLGAYVTAFDPEVKKLPGDLRNVIKLCVSPEEALRESEAVLVTKLWPDLKNLKAKNIIQWMKRPVVLDPGRYLSGDLGENSNIIYMTIGRHCEAKR